MEFRNTFTKHGLVMMDTHTVARDGFRCVEVMAPVAKMQWTLTKIFISLGIKNGQRQATFFGVNEVTTELTPDEAAPEEIWQVLNDWYEEVTQSDSPTENERVAEGI